MEESETKHSGVKRRNWCGLRCGLLLKQMKR